jgi:hypothetical protein
MKSQIEYDDIRLILLRNWDPIGINGLYSFDERYDTEYDSYAREIHSLILAGCKKVDVEKYLSWAEEYIGAGISSSRIRRVSSLILKDYGDGALG